MLLMKYSDWAEEKIKKSVIFLNYSKWLCVFLLKTIARQLAEILLRGMCEQSYWSPMEDPPTVSPLDDPSQQGHTHSNKTYSLSRRPRIYSGEKYGWGTSIKPQQSSSSSILLPFSWSFSPSLSLFCPQENTEEALLLLLISESMVRRSKPHLQSAFFAYPDFSGMQSFL